MRVGRPRARARAQRRVRKVRAHKDRYHHPMTTSSPSSSSVPSLSSSSSSAYGGERRVPVSTGKGRREWSRRGNGFSTRFIGNPVSIALGFQTNGSRRRTMAGEGERERRQQGGEDNQIIKDDDDDDGKTTELTMMNGLRATTAAAGGRGGGGGGRRRGEGYDREGNRGMEKEFTTPLVSGTSTTTTKMRRVMGGAKGEERGLTTSHEYIPHPTPSFTSSVRYRYQSPLS